MLIAVALERATPAQAAAVRATSATRRSTTADTERLQTIIVETGALEHVEALIDQRTAAAQAALEHPDLAEPARAVLAELATAATARAG